MLTEAEAKKRWCPFARYSPQQDDAAYNRTPKGPSQMCNCIASDCMAWRWGKKPAPHPETDGIMIYVDDDVGYCGLAGKP